MKIIRITGALINVAFVVVGSGIGLLLRGKLSDTLSHGIMRALGLCIAVIGISSALSGDIMLMVVSLALGAFCGEWIDIDRGLNRFGQFAERKIAKGDSSSSFAQGFVTATLVFCVGAMAVVGSIESGLLNDQGVILTKSILDFVSAMIFASSMGLGVLFSAVPILLYQGSIELFAGFLQPILTPTLVTQISAVGGVMIIGIGANLALDAKIKVANLLPGFLIAGVYYAIFLR